ncbi:ATP-binding cassette domain-containing protein [Reinekea thalattae]|uniref:ATP-binding cassette domain-containing protein n=1 Tax=Reinekea thalattae TaxID=2593301 RepID=A0A5C8Z9E9_9GAMM|nr:ATP-binding cassette domain-containing protein [Reinekea thalattae]TXR54004.1 ATP-binding cassette domain-containing protein [Reinekea thalattae]
MSFHVTSNRFISLLLAITQLGSGIILLALSSWFIAACALAGHAGVLAGFNYVIPATVIRFLAVVRIFSSYFEKYFGHISLLAELTDIRHRLLLTTFQGQSDINAADTAAILQEDSERVAGRWSAIYNPLAGALASIAGMSLIFAMLIPELLFSWAILLAILCAMTAVFSYLNQRAHGSVLAAYEFYYQQQHQWLSVSTLWHLRQDWITGEAVKNAADALFKARQRQHQLMHITETLIIVTGFSWPLWIIAELFDSVSPSAVWAIPLVLSASVRDWFMPIVGAFDQRTKLLPSARRVWQHSQPVEQSLITERADINEDTHSLQTAHSLQRANSLILKEVRWQRNQMQGTAISFDITKPGCYLISASSGTGKSSLFNALCGELNFSGEAWLNGVSLAQLTQQERSELIFYAEQFAHVFSDTLRQNLTMVCQPITEVSADDLNNALEWAELGHWAGDDQLRTWLGSEGKPISGGEKKRLSLARAYLSDRPIWLLDEPFEGLDSQLAEKLASKLSQISEDKIIVIASHIRPASLKLTEQLAF